MLTFNAVALGGGRVVDGVNTRHKERGDCGMWEKWMDQRKRERKRAGEGGGLISVCKAELWLVEQPVWVCLAQCVCVCFQPVGGGLSLHHVVPLASFPHKHTPSFAEGTQTHTHIYILLHTHSQLLILLSLCDKRRGSRGNRGCRNLLSAGSSNEEHLFGNLDRWKDFWSLPLFLPASSLLASLCDWVGVLSNRET